MSSSSKGWLHSLARFSRRARTETPRFWSGLRIHRKRLQAGLDDFLPKTSFHRKFCDLGGRGLAEPECFFHALRGVRKTGRRVVESFLAIGALEEINDGFCRRINDNRDALNGVVLNSFVKNLGAEAHNLNSRLSDLWAPLARTNRHPNESRNVVRKLVKGER